MYLNNRSTQKIIFVFYLIAVVIISTMPSSVIKIGNLWKYDKYIHFFEYLILGFLFLNCFSPFDYLPKVLVSMIVLIIVFAGIDEFIIQNFIGKYRYPDFYDWLMDVLGASSGILIRNIIGFRLK